MEIQLTGLKGQKWLIQSILCFLPVFGNQGHYLQQFLKILKYHVKVQPSSTIVKIMPLNTKNFAPALKGHKAEALSGGEQRNMAV